MSNLRKDTRTSALLALVAIGVLLAAGTVVLDAIEREYRRNIEGHVASTLETMTRLLDVLQQDAAARARTIADEPRHMALATQLIAAPEDRARHDEFERWITPLYRSRGFEGYSLLSADGKRIVTAGSRAYIGQAVSAATQKVLVRAAQQGAASTRPIAATRPVSTFGIEQPVGVPYQLTCARVDDGGGILGYLCLRENPALRLYRILEAGRSGESGETYVIDGEGRIISPIRFESRLAAPDDAAPGWSLFRLAARVMPVKLGSDRPDPAAAGNAPLTQVAARLLEHKAPDTGLLENYPDYRGREVVGAGRWLPEMAMGIVVEEDMDEAFRSYRFARNVVVSLIALGAFLIVTLSVLQWRARRSLARSEQQLAAFRDHLPGGMMMKDVAGRYVMVNPLIEQIFNVPAGQAIGRTDDEIMTPEEVAPRRLDHEEVLRTGLPIHRTYSHVDAEGKETVYRVVRFPIPDEDGAGIAGVGTVGIDTTDQVKAQRALEELTQTLEERVDERTGQLVAARDAAEAAGRAKAEFLANMSHEIRTPLNAIIGMSHLAAHVSTEPRVAHYLGRIQSSSRHLLGIVNDILDLSKIEAGKMGIESSDFSLERMLEHVAGLIWERADAKGLELIIDIEPGLPTHFVGDSMRIGQILINFANNAVKFTDHGEVILRVRMPQRAAGGATLRFEVEDTGIGIAEDKLPLLFAPFQQLDGSMARRFEGTGLGLAISKHLAELMGGRLAVATRVGEGSVFSLEIELRVSAAIPSPIVPTIDLRNRRVLAADDNALARRQLAGLLRSLSFRVDEAIGGQEAIDRVADADARDVPYELVFLDQKMPGLGGAEAAAQIHLLSLRCAAPRMVLMASGSGDSGMPEGAAGFDASLNKPVTPSELFDAVIGLFDPAGGRGRREIGEVAGWPDLRGVEILLVEDNPINQEVVHDLLGIVGASVTIAGDGLRALQLLNNQPFDVVLMDVHMPIMNGFEATARIREEERFASLPIIALTANALEGDSERCLAAGMSDYVAKPIDPRKLFSAIMHHLPQRATPVPRPGGDSPAAAVAPVATGSDRILAELATVPGLDLAGGLERMMGRGDLYLKLIARMVGERAEFSGQLRGALAADDREQLHGLVHGMKSLLGALGANELQQACLRLEATLQAGDPVDAAVGELCAGYEELLRNLRQATA